MLSPQEIERRRAASRRLAWLLGALALTFYIVGMFVPR